MEFLKMPPVETGRLTPKPSANGKAEFNPKPKKCGAAGLEPSSISM